MDELTPLSFPSFPSPPPSRKGKTAKIRFSSGEDARRRRDDRGSQPCFAGRYISRVWNPVFVVVSQGSSTIPEITSRFGCRLRCLRCLVFLPDICPFSTWKKNDRSEIDVNGTHIELWETIWRELDSIERWLEIELFIS